MMRDYRWTHRSNEAMIRAGRRGKTNRVLKLATAIVTGVSFWSAFAATVDPAMLQAVAAHVQQLDTAMGQHATRWTVDPGTKACLLRDGDDKANSRILFIRETGNTSMWLTPHAADIPAKIAGAQAYQIYLVPLGGDVSTMTATEFGAALWQEPLAKTGLPGLAIQADPAQLLQKFPGGFAVVLAQGGNTLFADIVRPEIAASFPELKKCRGGR